MTETPPPRRAWRRLLFLMRLVAVSKGSPRTSRGRTSCCAHLVISAKTGSAEGRPLKGAASRPCWTRRARPPNGLRPVRTGSGMAPVITAQPTGHCPRCWPMPVRPQGWGRKTGKDQRSGRGQPTARSSAASGAYSRRGATSSPRPAPQRHQYPCRFTNCGRQRPDG